jgi:hypothetical protein
MSRKLNNSVVRQVFFMIGKDSNTGEPMYRRAPFDVVLINGAVHVRPWIGGMNDQALSALAQDSQEDKDMWRQDIGYELLNPIILNENQMGDGSDNWMGLTSVSNI